MNFIVNYFSHVPDSHRIILLGVCLFVFGNLELLLSFKTTANKGKHILTNALFMLPAAPIQFGLGLIIIKTINYTQANNLGLLHLLPSSTNSLTLFVLGFVLLDFFEYVYHVIMHKVKRLWMFHLVHHSDRALTVSTTLREHPIETGIRLLFLVLWVLLSGISFWALLFRQFIQIASNVFVHANFRINERIDTFVSMLFVTPNMHQVHHHYVVPYTDTNYGDVLSVWDRLFGTFARAKATELQFGVDTYFDKKENTNYITLLKLPFGKYRSSAAITT
jgi:sterol desaturase/sphingolipid hydroxylase (fatty acid hydroxylase superfamily)